MRHARGNACEGGHGEGERLVRLRLLIACVPDAGARAEGLETILGYSSVGEPPAKMKDTWSGRSNCVVNQCRPRGPSTSPSSLYRSHDTYAASILRCTSSGAVLTCAPE